MTSPGTLLDATVDMIRATGTLVTDELGGDDSLISAYKDSFPVQANLLTAIYNAPRPSILVAYGGLIPGKIADPHINHMEIDQHKILAYFRSAEGVDYGYFDMLTGLLDGITLEGIAFRYSTIHENCYPPKDIHFRRVPHSDEADFWELSFLLSEIGG